MNFNLPKTKYELAGIAIVTGFLVYFGNRKYNDNKTYHHPTREFAEIALRMDQRIANFCGKRYRVTGYQWLNSDDRQVSYRIFIEGMRGKCKVLVKCDKYSHEYLKTHMKEQISYSKLSKEEKALTPFIPFDFNDVLIPTEETQKIISEVLSLKGQTNDLLIFNKDKYIAGEYATTLQESVKALKVPIRNIDTFFRFSSIVMVANDSLVFNVRPIGPKNRTYDIEDTYYSYKSYDDVVRKLHENRYKFNEILSDEFSAEEMRNEIILQKQTNFQERLMYRKYVTIFNCLLFLAGTFLVRLVFKNNLDFATLKMLQNKINNVNVKGLGNQKRFICVNYVGNTIMKNDLACLIMGENGLNGKTKINNKKSSINDDVFYLEFKESDIRIFGNSSNSEGSTGKINKEEKNKNQIKF